VCALGCTVLCLLLILSRRFLLLGIEFDACTKLAKEYYSWHDRRKPCTVTSSVFPVLYQSLFLSAFFSLTTLHILSTKLDKLRLKIISSCTPNLLQSWGAVSVRTYRTCVGRKYIMHRFAPLDCLHNVHSIL